MLKSLQKSFDIKFCCYLISSTYSTFHLTISYKYIVRAKHLRSGKIQSWNIALIIQRRYIWKLVQILSLPPFFSHTFSYMSYYIWWTRHLNNNLCDLKKANTKAKGGWFMFWHRQDLESTALFEYASIIGRILYGSVDM